MFYVKKLYLKNDLFIAFLINFITKSISFFILRDKLLKEINSPYSAKKLGLVKCSSYLKYNILNFET